MIVAEALARLWPVVWVAAFAGTADERKISQTSQCNLSRGQTLENDGAGARGEHLNEEGGGITRRVAEADKRLAAGRQERSCSRDRNISQGVAKGLVDHSGRESDLNQELGTCIKKAIVDLKSEGR